MGKEDDLKYISTSSPLNLFMKESEGDNTGGRILDSCPWLQVSLRSPLNAWWYLATFQTLLEFQARRSFLSRSGYCNFTRNYPNTSSHQLHTTLFRMNPVLTLCPSDSHFAYCYWALRMNKVLEILSMHSSPLLAPTRTHTSVLPHTHQETRAATFTEVHKIKSTLRHFSLLMKAACYCSLFLGVPILSVPLLQTRGGHSGTNECFLAF